MELTLSKVKTTRTALELLYTEQAAKGVSISDPIMNEIKEIHTLLDIEERAIKQKKRSWKRTDKVLTEKQLIDAVNNNGTVAYTSKTFQRKPSWSISKSDPQGPQLKTKSGISRPHWKDLNQKEIYITWSDYYVVSGDPNKLAVVMGGNGEILEVFEAVLRD